MGNSTHTHTQTINEFAKKLKFAKKNLRNLGMISKKKKIMPP